MALVQASNIMLEIMRSSQVAHSLVPRSAQLVYCALRRIIYIMCKCPAATPLCSTAVRCAAHVRLWLAPLTRSSQSRFRLPAHPRVSAQRASAAARLPLPPVTATPQSICGLGGNKSSCTCGQNSTVLEPSRPSPAGAPLVPHCAALTVLRAALVGLHVQKAFLGC